MPRTTATRSALRLGTHAQRSKAKHALHGRTRSEGRERVLLDWQRLADGHDRCTDRVRGEKTVEMRLGGQAAEKPDRVILARLRLEPRAPSSNATPVPAPGFPASRRLDGATDIVPGESPQRRAHAPLTLRLVQRGITDFAIPGVGFGQQLLAAV